VADKLADEDRQYLRSTGWVDLITAGVAIALWSWHPITGAAPAGEPVAPLVASTWADPSRDHNPQAGPFRGVSCQRGGEDDLFVQYLIVLNVGALTHRDLEKLRSTWRWPPAEQMLAVAARTRRHARRAAGTNTELWDGTTRPDLSVNKCDTNPDSLLGPRWTPKYPVRGAPAAPERSIMTLTDSNVGGGLR